MLKWRYIKKMESIEQNEGDIRIQHNKVVLNLLTKLRHEKKTFFFVALCNNANVFFRSHQAVGIGKSSHHRRRGFRLRTVHVHGVESHHGRSDRESAHPETGGQGCAQQQFEGIVVLLTSLGARTEIRQPNRPQRDSGVRRNGMAAPAGALEPGRPAPPSGRSLLPARRHQFNAD